MIEIDAKDLVNGVIGGLVVATIISVFVQIKAGGWKIVLRVAKLGDAGVERLKQLDDDGVEALRSVELSDIRRAIRLRNVDVFPFSRAGGSEVNDDFYNAFRKRIHAAQRLLIITGQGIVGDSQKEVDAMRAMVDEQVRIMGDKPPASKFKLIRIQTDRNVSPEWQACLERLLKEGGDRFELYFGPPQLTFPSVIDPKLPETCCAEIMIPHAATEVDVETGNIKEMAGLGVFYDHDTEQADFLALKIRRLLKEQMSTESYVTLATVRREQRTNLTEEDQKHDRNALKHTVVRVENVQQLQRFLKATREL